MLLGRLDLPPSQETLESSDVLLNLPQPKFTIGQRPTALTHAAQTMSLFLAPQFFASGGFG